MEQILSRRETLQPLDHQEREREGRASCNIFPDDSTIDCDDIASFLSGMDILEFWFLDWTKVGKLLLLSHHESQMWS